MGTRAPHVHPPEARAPDRFTGSLAPHPAGPTRRSEPVNAGGCFPVAAAVRRAGPHPGRPPAGPGWGHDASYNAVRNAYATPLTTPQTPGPIRPTSRETAKPTPAQQLPRQQPETSRPPRVRTNREHSSCFVLESRGRGGSVWKGGAMISGSRKTQCGSGPSALTCPCGPHDRPR